MEKIRHRIGSVVSEVLLEAPAAPVSAIPFTANPSDVIISKKTNKQTHTQNKINKQEKLNYNNK